MVFARHVSIHDFAADSQSRRGLMADKTRRTAEALSMYQRFVFVCTTICGFVLYYVLVI